MAREPNTPNDPRRKERIVDAAVDVLLDRGIAGVTARAVAAAADVPVGSVSYHFASVQALLREALQRVLELREASLRDWSHHVTAATVRDDLARLIHHQITDGRALTVIGYELEVQGLRDADLAAVGDAFTRLVHDHLAPHCAPGTARLLTATADGLQLQSLLAATVPSIPELAAILAGVEVDAAHAPDAATAATGGDEPPCA